MSHCSCLQFLSQIPSSGMRIPKEIQGDQGGPEGLGRFKELVREHFGVSASRGKGTLDLRPGERASVPGHLMATYRLDSGFWVPTLRSAPLGLSPSCQRKYLRDSELLDGFALLLVLFSKRPEWNALSLASSHLLHAACLHRLSIWVGSYFFSSRGQWSSVPVRVFCLVLPQIFGGSPLAW